MLSTQCCWSMCSYVGGKRHLWCWAKLWFYEEILKRTAEWVFDEVSSHTEGKRWQRGSGVCKFITAYSQQDGEFCKSAHEKNDFTVTFAFICFYRFHWGKFWILRRSLLWRCESLYKIDILCGIFHMIWCSLSYNFQVFKGD